MKTQLQRTLSFSLSKLPYLVVLVMRVRDLGLFYFGSGEVVPLNVFFFFFKDFSYFLFIQKKEKRKKGVVLLVVTAELTEL